MTPNLVPNATMANNVMSGRGNITKQAGVYASTTNNGAHQLPAKSCAQPMMLSGVASCASGVKRHASSKPATATSAVSATPQRNPDLAGVMLGANCSISWSTDTGRSESASAATLMAASEISG